LLCCAERLTITRSEDRVEFRSLFLVSGRHRPGRSGEIPTSRAKNAREMGHPVLMPDACFLFQFGCDEELLPRRVVLHAQHVRLAANLAVFDVALPPSRGLIDGGRIPFSAGRTLETGFHDAESIAQQLRLRRRRPRFSVSR
jgi:hypothetical protein